MRRRVQLPLIPRYLGQHIEVDHLQFGGCWKFAVAEDAALLAEEEIGARFTGAPTRPELPPVGKAP